MLILSLLEHLIKLLQRCAYLRKLIQAQYLFVRIQMRKFRAWDRLELCRIPTIICPGLGWPSDLTGIFQ